MWPTKEWQSSTPEEQGMDSTALAGLVEFGTSRSFDSLLIVRHGRIVLDAYYAPYSADLPHAINSATSCLMFLGNALSLILLIRTDYNFAAQYQQDPQPQLRKVEFAAKDIQ